MGTSFRHLTTVLALAPLATACSDDSSSVGFMEPPTAIVTAASVTAGEVVPIRLENRSAVAWSYDMCGKALLQRREGDLWITLPPPLVLCANELVDLPPGEVVDAEKYVPLGIEPGTHRVLMIYELQGEEFERASNSFEVTAPAG